MSPTRRRFFVGVFVALTILLVYACLAVIFPQLVYDFVVWPLHYAGWYVNLLIKSFPQFIFLALLAGTGLVMGLLSVPRFRRRHAAAVERLTPLPETRFQHWGRWAKESDRQAVMGKILAEDLREFLIQVLIDQEALPRWQVEAAVEAQTLATPPEVQMLVVHHRLSTYARSPGFLERLEARLRRWLHLPEAALPDSVEASRFDKAIREVISYLEQRVEVQDDKYEH